MKYILSIVLLVILNSNITEIAETNRIKSEAAEAYLKGDYALAVEKYQFLVDSFDIDNDTVQLNIANAHYNLKDTARAEDLYKALRESTQNDIRSVAFQQMGLMAGNQKKYEKALGLFKKALKADPGNEESRYNYELLKKLLNDQQQNKDQQDNQDQNQENKENKDQQDKENKENKDQQNKEGEQDKESKEDKENSEKEGKDDSKDNKEGEGEDSDKKEGDKKEDKEGDEKSGKEEGEEQKQDGKEQGDEKQEGKQEEDKEGEGGEKQEQGEEGEEKEQGGNEEKQGEKGGEEDSEEDGATKGMNTDKTEKVKEISEQKARIFLEDLRQREVQYFQQNRRKSSKRKNSDKPDW